MYQCNGLASWYATLVLVAVLHYTGIVRLEDVADNYGPLMTVSVITGNLVSLLVYYAAFWNGVAHRCYGNFFYDYFMGSYLNPRIGRVDLKMYAEIRISWILLFILTLAACK